MESLALKTFFYFFLLLMTFSSRCTLCVHILCLFSALSRRVGALQIAIIIIIIVFVVIIIINIIIIIINPDVTLCG